MAHAAYRIETVARVAIMAAIGVMAGAASFTHMHDWTMDNSPAGTPQWFGWANAVVSELTPTLALLEIRRRHRTGKPLGYPLAILIASGLLSLAAQVAQANPSWSGRLLAALPAIGFIALTKLVFSGLGSGAETTEPLPANETNVPTESTQDTPAPVNSAPAPAMAAPVVSAPRPVPASVIIPARINGAAVNTR